MPLKPGKRKTSHHLRQRTGPAPPEFISALVEELPCHGNQGIGVPPSIYVASDFDQAADALGATARYVVGSGMSEPGAVRPMLRRCAPLAREGWQMLCEVVDDRLRYGVIASGDDQGMGSCPPEAWRPAGPEFANIGDGFWIWEPDGGVVAMRVVADMLRNEPPNASASEPRPLDRLVAVATEHGADGAQVHLTRLFDHALAKRTGTLVAVVPQSWKGGRPCEDAIVLEAPIDLPRLTSRAGTEGLSRVVVAQHEALAASMIREDGIAVFDDAARLRAYRWFVPFSPGGEHLSGGARERAFRALENLVSEGVLRAAFIQSSDGTMGFVSGETGSSAPFHASAPV